MLFDQTLVREKVVVLMTSDKLKTASFEDGTYAVLRIDPRNPRLMEVIATFFDAAHARDYVRLQGSNPSTVHRQDREPVAAHVSKPRPPHASGAKPKQSSKPKQASAANPKLVSEAKPKRATQAQPKSAPKAKLGNVETNLSERQAAVLKALRSLMDKKNRVEVTGAELAKDSSVPLGSLHSILASLEKKQIIRTARQGSAKFSPVYEVLGAARKSTHPLNGSGHSKESAAKTAAR